MILVRVFGIDVNDYDRLANRLENDLDKATSILAQLKDNGINIYIITQKLEDEGIEKFNKVYNKLLEAVKSKKM